MITNLIINILLMAFAVLSVYDLIYDKKKPGKGLAKITRNGRGLILIAVLTIAFNLKKDIRLNIEQRDAERKIAMSDSLRLAMQEELIKQQLSTKDTIIYAINETYINSIKASNEALAQYNLVIQDSLESVVSKLELESLKPQLLISPQEKERKMVYLSDEGKELIIKFISKAGTSYNISIFYYVIEGLYKSNNLLDFRDMHVLASGMLGLGNSFITEGVESSRSIPISPEILDKNEILIYIRGSFTKDPEGKLVVDYEEALVYNFKENQFVTKYELNYNLLDKHLGINEAVAKKD